MDPDHVISGTGITRSNRESIFYLPYLRYSVVLIYLYSCDTGSFYYTNIQYTQLLYWAILVVHIYYPVSFILGCSSVPVLSNITPFYWATLIEQDFIINPLFSMVLSFIFGSLYQPSIIMIRILCLVYSIDPVSFIYANYFWAYLLTHILIYYLYFWADLLDQLHYWFSLSTQSLLLSAWFLGYSISPYFFLFLGLSIRPILLHWTTLVYQSIQILGLLYRPSFLILVFFFLGYSIIRIIFLIYFFYWATIADQYFIPLFIFLGYYTDPVLLFSTL